jgi:rhodanese-related sulfurtransferase
VKYTKMGYTNVKALLGGVEAWKKAGYKLARDK